MQSAHSVDEQVYDVVNGKQHYMDVYYLLKRSGPKQLSEIATELGKSKPKVSTHLNDLRDRGLLRFEWNSDGAKEWDLTAELVEATTQPQVVEREVEVERSYDTINEFLEEHRPIAQLLRVILVTGILLVAFTTLMELLSFPSFSPLGAIGGVLFWGSLIGLLTIRGMGWRIVHGGDD